MLRTAGLAGLPVEEERPCDDDNDRKANDRERAVVLVIFHVLGGDNCPDEQPHDANGTKNAGWVDYKIIPSRDTATLKRQAAAPRRNRIFPAIARYWKTLGQRPQNDSSGLKHEST